VTDDVERARAGADPDAERDALTELTEAGDVAAILDLAKRYRAGADGTPRDLARCLACYEAAAELGSAEAEYAVALFYLTGGVVAQDLKEGAARLRVAADAGSIPAKVYLANLYELGIHYSQDAAKADVWYRSAARAAFVTASPGSDEHARAMAEIGAARFALALAGDPEASEADRARYLKKARASGYQLRIKDDAAAAAEATARASVSSGAPAGAGGTQSRAAVASVTGSSGAGKPRGAAPADEAASEAGAADDEASAPPPERAVKAERAEATKRAAKRARPSSLGPSLAAFVYATIFFAAAVGAGYLAMHGAEEVIARRGELPVFGDRVALVFPSFVFVLGVLPTLLVYRARTVVQALIGGGLAWWIGFAAWTRWPFVHARTMEALAASIAGFLAALLVLGLAGGARKQGPGRRG